MVCVCVCVRARARVCVYHSHLMTVIVGSMCRFEWENISADLFRQVRLEGNNNVLYRQPLQMSGSGT